MTSTIAYQTGIIDTPHQFVSINYAFQSVNENNILLYINDSDVLNSISMANKFGFLVNNISSTYYYIVINNNIVDSNIGNDFHFTKGISNHFKTFQCQFICLIIWNT